MKDVITENAQKIKYIPHRSDIHFDSIHNCIKYIINNDFISYPITIYNYQDETVLQIESESPLLMHIPN